MDSNHCKPRHTGRGCLSASATLAPYTADTKERNVLPVVAMRAKLRWPATWEMDVSSLKP